VKPWDDDATAMLKDLCAKGLSYGNIAQLMGFPFTRNSVLGKANRMGLAQTARGTRLNRQSQQSVVSSKSKKSQQTRENISFGSIGLKTTGTGSVPPIDPTVFEPDLVIPVEERKTLVQLENNHCRWPIGDPLEAEFHFCGKDKITGLSYCEFHARRAYATPLPRRKAESETDVTPAPNRVREKV
jgi:GcrA cell cycle regulator